MKHKVQLGSHVIYINTYTTELELNVLEEIWCESSDTQDKSDEHFETLVIDFLQHLTDFNVLTLSKIERVLLVWKIRALTIGDEISIVFKCPECKRVSQNIISVDSLCLYGDLVSRNTFTSNLISRKQLNELRIEDLDIEDLDIEDFNELQKNPERFFNVYETKTELECSSCGYKVYDNLLTYKNCLKFISEESFMSLTEWLNVLVYYGHLTREDVLKMSPIQRMLEIKYFKKIKEKETSNV